MIRSHRLASRIGHALLPSLAALLFGCGDSVTQSGTGGSGGSGASGGGTTTTAAGGAGGAGTGGAPECSAYGWPEAPSVTIHVVNQTGAPIYIPNSAACGYSETLSIVDSLGHTDELLEPGTGCGSWCSFFLEGDCLCEVTPSCNNEAVRVEAGQAYDSPWSGLVDESTTMPAACLSPDCQAAGSQTCLWRVAPTGDVTITARAWTEMNCMGGCPCDPNHPEACVVSGVVGGTKISATTTLTQVEPGTVDVVFQ